MSKYKIKMQNMKQRIVSVECVAMELQKVNRWEEEEKGKKKKKKKKENRDEWGKKGIRVGGHIKESIRVGLGWIFPNQTPFCVGRLKSRWNILDPLKK